MKKQSERGRRRARGKGDRWVENSTVCANSSDEID